MGLTEVMRLLKDVGEEGIDIQVVSVMENNPSMVSVDLVFACELSILTPFFLILFVKTHVKTWILKKVYARIQLCLTVSPREF